MHMTRKEAERQTRQADTLRSLGFTDSEAEALRRISMTLRRWYEAECNGDIQRDETDNKPYAHYGNRAQRYPIADRETGAIKRLKGIVDARNKRVVAERQVCPNCGQWQYGDCLNECVKRGLAPLARYVSYYLQTDPRGASLYIIRPGDVPEGADVASYYNRGIVVY